MKAIVQDTYGSADVLQLRDVARPEIRDDEVLVRVHAAGVDPGVWHLMTGMPYLVRFLGFGVFAPKVRIRGRDVAGRVEAVGAKVTELRPGDAVFGTCEGSFAEYACARADKLAHKPERLRFEEAAAVPISGVTALQALHVGEIEAGHKVLVIGAAGGVGTFAVQLAKHYGAEVTGVCSTGKGELVRSLGADHVVDYTREDFADRGSRYDLILDIAGRRPLSYLRRALGPRGTLVFVGGEGGSRWFGGMGRPLWASLISPFLEQNLRMFIAIERKEDLASLSELIESGRVRPVIDRTYTLDEAPEAIRQLERGHSRGKAVIAV
jgi:NADPH:quinone reductase-like Zn-dependent oxidoreductase